MSDSESDSESGTTPSLVDAFDARLTGVSSETTEVLDRIVCPDHGVAVLSVLDDADGPVTLDDVETELVDRLSDDPTPGDPSMPDDLGPNEVQGTLGLLSEAGVVDREGATYEVENEVVVEAAVDQLGNVPGAVDLIDEPAQVRDLLRLGRAHGEVEQSEIAPSDDESVERRLRKLEGGVDGRPLVENRYEHHRELSLRGHGRVESTCHWSLTDRGETIEDRLRAVAETVERTNGRGEEQCDRPPG